MKQKDFSRFGKNFQENLVRLMFDDRAFCRQLMEVLEFQFFELKYLQVFVQKLSEYFGKYGTYPTITAMTSIIKSEVDEEDAVKSQLKEFFSKIISATEPLEDEEYIKETSLEFCKKKKLQEALTKSVSLVEKSKFTDIKSLIEHALKLGSDNNFGHDYKLDFEERYKITARDPISTGIPEIDKITQGGFGKGELSVIVAATGRGKSFVLCHLAASAMKQGKSVVYYTLELLDSTIGQRIDSALSKIPLDDLKTCKDEVYDEIIKVKGNLIIKAYAARSVSVQTISNHLSKLVSSGFKPDMVIVDYADLLRATTTRESTYSEREEIYEELRGMFSEFGVCGISASQCNRSGINQEILSLESIADSFAKCFVSDFIFTLSRTQEDQKANRGRFFIAKNRNGIDGIIFNARVDLSTCTFEILSEYDKKTEEDNSRTKMRDIFKQMKEEM